MLDWLRAFLDDSRVARWGLLAVAALVVLGLVGFGGWTWYRSQQAQGAAALAAAVELAQKALAPGATPETRAGAAQALEAVIAQHPRYAGLPEAAYRLGNVRYAAGEYAAACLSTCSTTSDCAAGEHCVRLVNPPPALSALIDSIARRKLSGALFSSRRRTR